MAILKAINTKATEKAALRSVIRYVLQHIKTEASICDITGPFAYNEITPTNVYHAFMDIKKEFQKVNGRLYEHKILSFHKDEEITFEEALAFAKEWAEKWYADNQVLFATHIDRDHIHIHMIINNVSYMDGSKAHWTRRDYENMKKHCNELCKQYGYSVAEKGKCFDGSPRQNKLCAYNNKKYFAIKNLDDDSFVVQCGTAVSNAVNNPNVMDRDSFIEAMWDQGWETTWEPTRKHITFKNKAGKKVRDTNLQNALGIDATKESISNIFVSKLDEMDSNLETIYFEDEYLLDD